MTLLPESLRQYLPMIIAAQIILFASAILVGGFLIIRRLSRRPPLEGQMLEEKEKLAAEIHTEIGRLRELRDRLFDGYGEGNEPTFALKTLQQTPAGTSASALALSAAAAAAGVGPTVKETELLKINENLNLQLAAMKEEIEKLKSGAASAGGVASSAAPVNLDEIRENLKKTLEPEIAERFRAETKEKLSQQELKIKDLSNRLEEYEIFEEELTQIKKYKQENEQLKQQVGSGGPAMTPAFSEDDIAQLFNEMSVGGGLDLLGTTPNVIQQAAPAVVVAEKPITPAPTPVKIEAAKPAPIPEKTIIKEAVKAEPIPEPEISPGLSLDAELEKFLASSENLSDALSSPSNAGTPEGFVAEATTAEPDVISVDQENAEALAMLGGDQDELMKEFEKVLAPTPKDK